MLDTKAYGELSNKLIAALGAERKQEIYDAIIGNSAAKDNIIKILDYITLLFFQDYVNKINA
jgi:hypothetical protein